MRTTIKTVTPATAKRYEAKADECWKQFPVGATCFHILTGAVGTVLTWDVMTGTGWVKYHLKTHDGETFALRFLIRRIKLPHYARPGYRPKPSRRCLIRSVSRVFAAPPQSQIGNQKS